MIEIALNDVRLYCYHGYYEEERIIGAWYNVNVRVAIPDYSDIRADELSSTLNYESLHLVIRKVMSEPCDLLETLAAAMREEIQFLHKGIRRIEISIQKLDPPLKGIVGSSECVLKSDLQAKDPVSKKAFSCYKSAQCWCRQDDIDQVAYTRLKQQSGGCVSHPTYFSYVK